VQHTIYASAIVFVKTANSSNWALAGILSNARFRRQRPGQIHPAALAVSTVDITQPFARMVINRRAFCAKTSVNTTGDEMIDELVRLTR